MNLNPRMADSIITATAEVYDAQIVTSDKHLRKVDKVKFINNQDHQHVVK